MTGIVTTWILLYGKLFLRLPYVLSNSSLTNSLPFSSTTPLLPRSLPPYQTDAHSLPTARTCTFNLRLPVYETKGSLEEGFRVALHFGLEGFGMQ